MNNILHLRYAVEVERTGSISKAAENLYMGQPHLSKAIRDLEDSLGIKIFNRTSKGVVPTQKGKGFIEYAKSILSQIDEMEARYKPAAEGRQEFSLAVPRASYISYAFTEFLKTLNYDNEINVNYRETHSVRAISDVAASVDNLAIIRYQRTYEKYFLNCVEENDLKYQKVREFEYYALMSASHPLSKYDVVSLKDLQEYPEITHGDITIPALPVIEARELAKSISSKKNISVYERGSQLEILNRVPTTYMWVSPMPKDVLKRFDLVQKRCDMSENIFCDVLIYRKGYHMSPEDKKFIDILHKSVKEIV